MSMNEAEVEEGIDGDGDTKPMIEIRLCTEKDWRAMTRLRMSRPTHAGAEVSRFASNPINMVDTRYQFEPNLAVGMFIDNKLEAYICCYSLPTLWVLDLMVSSAKGTQAKALHRLLNTCLDIYEQRNITEFWYAFPNKWARAYRSFWKQSTPLLRKYTIEDVCIIAENRIPADPFIWEEILHQCVVPVPFLLRRSYVAKTS